MSLAVFVGLKYCHIGSARSLQLAVANEVSVTNGGDSAGEAAHQGRRGSRELWKTVRPGARGLFIYAEDDGWPERMLGAEDRRSVRAPRTRCHTRSTSYHLEELMYSFAERVNMGSPSRAGGVWWTTCSGGSEASKPQSSQLAARRDAAWFSWGGIGSVLPGAAQAAIGLMNVGAAVVGVACCPRLRQGGRTDKCRQETMQKHTGLLKIGGCFRGGRCPCSFSSGKPTGSRSEGVGSRFCRSSRWVITTTRSFVTTLVSCSFGERAGRDCTNAANRTKANLRWTEYSDGDRSQFELRWVLEAALLCNFILTALASSELPRR